MELFSKLVEPLEGGGEAATGEDHHDEVSDGAEDQKLVITAKEYLQKGFDGHNEPHSNGQLENLYEERSLYLGFYKSSFNREGHEDSRNRAEEVCARVLCRMDVGKLCRSQSGGGGGEHGEGEERRRNGEEAAEDTISNYGLVARVFENGIESKGERHAESKGNSNVKGRMHTEVHS